MSPAQRSLPLTERSSEDDPDHTRRDDLAIHPWGHSRHAHQSGQLVHARSGRAHLTIHTDDGRAVSTHTVDDTSAIWVPPTVWHSARFDPDFSPSVHDLDLDPSQTRVVVMVVAPAVRAELLATQWRPDGDLTLTRQALSLQPRTPNGPPPQPTGPLSSPMAEALNLDPADPRDLDTWAQTLHTSTISIRRAFKADTGLTWSAWRTQHRVHAAVQLLASGGRPSRVAANVGLSDAGLAAAIHRHYGCTPSALRSEAQVGKSISHTTG